MSYIKAIKFLKNNFAEQINQQLKNTPYTLDLVCGIACKETASKWVNWLNYPPETILRRCVFDASGDFPGTFRSAFPRNKNEFQLKYGISLTEELIEEANLMRAMPQPGYPEGYKPADYLYKGYGIFQYDLQNILTDEGFFTQKKWYNFDDCLARLIMILDEKRKLSGDLKTIVKHYNGSGPKAEQYADEVFAYIKLSSTIV